MSELLIAELLRFCKDTYGVDLRHAGGAGGLWHAEWCLLKVLVQVGRAVMARWFTELTTTGKQDRPRTIERDGCSIGLSATDRRRCTDCSGR